MLYHWNMIEPHDEQIHRELMLMPLLFASYENYVVSSKSFQEGWNWMEDLNICQKPTKYGQSIFCEAVKVDLENSKDLSLKNTITSTLSLITVLFEDLFEPSPSTGITVVKKWGWNHWPHYWIKPIHVINMTLTLTSSLMRSMHSKKNHCCCLRFFCIFCYREFYKKMLCILMVVNKTIYGNNRDVPDILLNMFLSSSPGIRNHMNWQVVAPDPVFPQSYWTILKSLNAMNGRDRPLKN